jgi:hypothetical protein
MKTLVAFMKVVSIVAAVGIFVTGYAMMVVALFVL